MMWFLTERIVSWDDVGFDRKNCQLGRCGFDRKNCQLGRNHISIRVMWVCKVMRRLLHFSQRVCDDDMLTNEDECVPRISASFEAKIEEGEEE